MEYNNIDIREIGKRYIGDYPFLQASQRAELLKKIKDAGSNPYEFWAFITKRHLSKTDARVSGIVCAEKTWQEFIDFRRRSEAASDVRIKAELGVMAFETDEYGGLFALLDNPSSDVCPLLRHLMYFKMNNKTGMDKWEGPARLEMLEETWMLPAIRRVMGKEVPDDWFRR